MVEFAAIDDWVLSRVFSPSEQGSVFSDDFPGFPLYQGSIHFEQEAELAQFLSDGEPPIVFAPTSLLTANQELFRSVAVALELGRRAILLTPEVKHVPPALPAGSGILDLCPMAGYCHTRRPSFTTVESVPWLQH